MSRTKKIAQIVMILIIGFAFGSGIASAEYLGPDRTYQVIESEACQYGVWVHDAGYHECYSADGSWADACIDCGWECEPGSACGQATRYYSLGTKLVEHTVTHTDPEATVAITPNCGAWGDASWCLQPSSVTITANEPVSGEQITLIEGTQNGDAFACAANTCTVNVMGEGSNAFTYWALSSYGDSSRMGTHTALQDTIAPEINASVTGTMGDNGWFVSNAVLSVAFTDTLPGSGISSSSALFNGILTDVSSPVTITEGVYNIQLDTRDAASWTASASQTISVDTTAPAVTANQPPIEVANSDVTGGGYVNGSVVFTGTCSDATSGVNRIEISTDGSALTSIAPNPDGTWTLDWDSSMLSDGTYTPVITAVDDAGNRTEITMQPLTLDNSAPAMSMTGAWYIWDSGHIEVFDSRVGIEHIELSVRDGQNRWPAREWYYDTDKLVMDLQWDRKFGDDTVAPTGDYEVLLQAWDRLGNGRYITSRIYIPEAGATAVIPLGDVVSGGTFEDTPTPMAQQTQTEDSGVVPAAPAATEEAPTSTPEPSSTPSSLNFSSAPVIPASGESKSTSLPVDPNLLTGAAALAAAASATAYSLQRKEEKEAERKRQEAESRAEAMAKVNAAQAVKEANAYAYNMIKKEYGNVTGSDINNNSGLKELYNYHKNNKLGIPTAPPDEETLSEIDEFLQKSSDASSMADERAEHYLKTQAYYAATIAAYQEKKKQEEAAAKKAAEEYSNQAKSFHEAEQQSMESYYEWERQSMERYTQYLYRNFVEEESHAQENYEKWEKWNQVQSQMPNSLILPGMDHYNYSGESVFSTASYYSNVGDYVLIDEEGNLTFNPIKVGHSVYDIGETVSAVNVVSNVKIKYLSNGTVSFSGSIASKAPVKDLGYKVSSNTYTLAEMKAISSKGLINATKNTALSPKNLITAGIFALIENLYDYGVDESSGDTFIDRTIKNPEFWLSTGVDFVMNIAIGVLAGLVAAAIIAICPISIGFIGGAILAGGMGMLLGAALDPLINAGKDLIMDGVSNIGNK